VFYQCLFREGHALSLSQADTHTFFLSLHAHTHTHTHTNTHSHTHIPNSQQRSKDESPIISLSVKHTLSLFLSSRTHTHTLTHSLTHTYRTADRDPKKRFHLCIISIRSDAQPYIRRRRHSIKVCKHLSPCILIHERRYSISVFFWVFDNLGIQMVIYSRQYMEYERERVLSVLKRPVAAKNHEFQMVMSFAITNVMPEYGIHICISILINMYVYIYV